jgi:hypothetical protein
MTYKSDTEARCTHCGEIKPLSEFPRDKVISTGLSSWCRSCHREASRLWRAKKRAAYDEAHTCAEILDRSGTVNP